MAAKTNDPIIYGVCWAARLVPQEYDSVVKWEVFELAGVDSDTNKPYYSLTQETGVGGDGTDDIDKAPVWLNISIKWDGCSHINFNDEGYMHACGFDDWNRFNKVITDLFVRSGRIMRRQGNKHIESAPEFPEAAYHDNDYEL